MTVTTTLDVQSNDRVVRAGLRLLIAIGSLDIHHSPQPNPLDSSAVVGDDSVGHLLQTPPDMSSAYAQELG